MDIHLLFSIHTNQLEAQIRFTKSIGRYHGRQEYEKIIFNPRSLEEKIVTRSLERPVNRTPPPPPSTFDTIHLIDMKFGTYNKLHLYFQLSETEKDMKSRKALAWVACNKLNKIWHSTLANETKVYIIKTLIEPILLYGAETWTLTTRQQKRLDGAYTNMLRRVQNIHWSEHATLEHIYGDIPPLSQKVIKRRLSFDGHCH